MEFAKLAALSIKLRENPPCFVTSEKRRELMLEVDELLGEANSEKSAELGKFYRMQVDNMLDEISAYSGTIPRMWKFYSSGIMVKDKERTFSLDINLGCLPPHGRSKLHLTEEQIGKIADLVDEHYVSHAHDDHTSGEICDAVSRRGKKVIMPQQALEAWMIDGIAAEKWSVPHCLTFLNWQGNASGGMPCAMYLFTLSNGKTLFTRGDIYHKEGFDGCLETVRKSGKAIDYACLTPYFTSGEAPVKILDEIYHCRFLNLHEWEFAHRPMGRAGEATQCFRTLYKEFAEAYADNRLALLTWGESIALD